MACSAKRAKVLLYCNCRADLSLSPRGAHGHSVERSTGCRARLKVAHGVPKRTPPERQGVQPGQEPHA
eukprot:9003123-Lingulodinium_polyedra.AAC.1